MPQDTRLTHLPPEPEENRVEFRILLGADHELVRFECRAKEPDGVTICNDHIRPEHMGTHALSQHQAAIYTVNASIAEARRRKDQNDAMTLGRG